MPNRMSYPEYCIISSLFRLLDLVGEVLETIIRSMPEDSQVQEEYAYWLYQSGRHKEAAIHFQRALSMDPKNYDAFCGQLNGFNVILIERPIAMFDGHRRFASCSR
jgi:tetratricopeptide (TPR) repeat protein